VDGVAFSPDGTQMASFDRDGIVTVWASSPHSEEQRWDTALALIDQGAYADAGPLLAELLAGVLASGEEETIRGYSNPLAFARMMTGDLEGARSVWETQLQIQRQALGPDHGLVGDTVFGLAMVAEEAGDLDDALSLFVQSAAITRSAMGPDDPETVSVEESIAAVHAKRGEWREAADLYARALQLRDAGGSDLSDIEVMLPQMAEAFEHAGDLDAALSAAERILAHHEREDWKLGEPLERMVRVTRRMEDEEALSSWLERLVAVLPEAKLLAPLAELASVQSAAGSHNAAFANRQRHLEIAERLHGPDSASVMESLLHLGAASSAALKMREALDACRRAGKLYADSAGHPDSGIDLLTAEAAQSIMEYREARDLVTRAIEELEKRPASSPEVEPRLLALRAELDQVSDEPLDTDDDRFWELAARVGESMTASKELRENEDAAGAARVARDALDILERELGADHYLTSVAHHSLGLAHEAGGDLARAEASLMLAVERSGPAQGAELARASRDLGRVRHGAGDHAGAAAAYGEAFRLGLAAKWNGTASAGQEKMNCLIDAGELLAAGQAWQADTAAFDGQPSTVADLASRVLDDPPLGARTLPALLAAVEAEHGADHADASWVRAAIAVALGGLGEFERAIEVGQHAVTTEDARQPPAPEVRAWAREALGTVLVLGGEAPRGAAVLRGAAQDWQELGEAEAHGRTMATMAVGWARHGRLHRATVAARHAGQAPPDMQGRAWRAVARAARDAARAAPQVDALRRTAAATCATPLDICTDDRWAWHRAARTSGDLEAARLALDALLDGADEEATRTIEAVRTRLGVALAAGGVGVLLVVVEPDSNAGRSGLHSGDIVITYDGTPVNESGAFVTLVNGTEGRASFDLAVVRGDRVLRTRVDGGRLGVEFRALP
jgi:tetratricopeptide (TPR) repeat protein